MYEVGVGTEVRAFHVMPGMEGPEGVPHPHDYRIEVVARRAELDERAMVCDIDLLQGALEETAARVRDEDLDAIRPPDADAVTVELFARWVYSAIADAARRAGAEALAVRVWESPVAFGGYSAPLDGPDSSS